MTEWLVPSCCRRAERAIFGEPLAKVVMCISSNLTCRSLLLSETEPGAGRGSHPELGRVRPRRDGDHA